MTRYPAPASGFFVGQHVDTPDGPGWVLKVHPAPTPYGGFGTKAERVALAALPPESVEVAFGDPVRDETKGQTYLYESARAYAPEDLMPRRTAAEVTPADVDAWIANRATPGFKPKPLPKPNLKPPRLADAVAAALWADQVAISGTEAQRKAFAEHGADGLFQGAPDTRRNPAPVMVGGERNRRPEYPLATSGPWAVVKLGKASFGVVWVPSGLALPMAVMDPETGRRVTRGTDGLGNYWRTATEAKRHLAVIAAADPIPADVVTPTREHITRLVEINGTLP